MFGDTLMPSSDEFDVSDAGIPELKGALATITDFEVIEKNGNVAHELTFEVEGLGFPITKQYWWEYPNNQRAVQAGRGQLKRIAKAATGTTKYNRTSLIGKRIKVDVGEDNSGFAAIKKIASANGD